MMVVTDNCANEELPTIALFYDGNYVDTQVGCDGEAYNVWQHLIARGFPVVLIDQLNDYDQWSDALGQANILLLPALTESGNFLADMPMASVGNLLQTFVANNGGKVLTMGGGTGANKTANVLNALYGFGLTETCCYNGNTSYLNLGNALYSAFQNGPTSIGHHFSTQTITGMPPFTKAMYEMSTNGEATVALMPKGNGSILYFGWSFRNGGPLCSDADTDFTEVLNRSLLQLAGQGIIITQSPEAYSTFAGQHGDMINVTISAIDYAGNESSCTTKLTLVDDEDPTIMCDNVVTQLENTIGICGYHVTDFTLDPTFTDNCTATMKHDYLSAPHLWTLNGALLPIGQTTVTWTVTDEAGNSKFCVVTYTVEDTEAPVAMCIEELDAVLNGDGTFQITPSMLDINSMDNCGLDTKLVSLDNAIWSADVDVDCDMAGTTVTAYLQITDAAGNASVCEVAVNVYDFTPPVIECPGNYYVANDGGVCYATVSEEFTHPVYTHDNCDFTIYHQVSGATTESYTAGLLGDNYVFNLGANLVTYTIVDGSGNSALCSFYVFVSDEEAPTVDACPGDIVVANDEDECGAVVDYEVAFSDNCDTDLDLTLVKGLVTGAEFPVGTTEVLWTATDDAGNDNYCQFYVTVNDTENPVIECPDDIVVDINGDVTSGEATVLSYGPCGLTLSYDAPVGTDNCPNVFTQSLSGLGAGPNYYSYGGFYTETYQAVDAAGNTAECSFTVTIEDPVNPTITCPDDITVQNDPGVCGAEVVYTYPLGFDNCPGYSVVQSAGPNSGEYFELGNTYVAFTISDDAGNSLSCSFTVTVIDTEAPVITDCAPDQDVLTSSNGLGDCSGIVPDLTGQVVAEDNCPGELTITQSPVAGSTFSGAHGDELEVTITVTDAAGNSSSCTVTLTLIDDEDPTIDCSEIATGPLGTNNEECTHQISGTAQDPTWFDNCAAKLSHDYAPAPHTWTLNGAILGLGETTVTWTITDEAGNSASCTVTYTVVDDDAPVAQCIAEMDAVLEGDGTFQLTPAMLDAASFDNCGEISLLISRDGDFGDFIYAGCNDAAAWENDGEPFTATLQVTDEAGNVSTCDVEIHTYDLNPPIIECVDNVYVSNDLGVCEAVVDGIGLEYVYDNCDVTVSYTIFGATNDGGDDDASGTSFAVGTSTVIYTVVDQVGNETECLFHVFVTDAEAPVLDCSNINPVRDNDEGFCSFTMPGAGFDPLPPTDNCGVVAFYNDYNYASTLAGETFPVGVTTVTWYAIDEAGNVTTCTIDITILDTEAPVVDCSAIPTVVSSTNFECGYIITTSAFDAAYSDNCGADISHDYIFAPNTWTLAGATLPVGTTVITWTAVDEAGNSASCTVSITVEDVEAPYFTLCPEDIEVAVDVDECGAYVNWQGPEAEDNCAATVVQTDASGLTTGDMFGVGVTTIEYTATDAAGNSAICTFTVTVTETQNPVAICQDITVYLDAAGNATILASDVDGGSYDNCAVESLEININAFTCLNVGDNNVTLTVTDATGNTEVCVATVTVVDAMPPTFTCPAPTSVSGCDQLVPDLVSLVTDAADNCGVATIEQNPVAGTDFGNQSGQSIIVTITVTDVNGNETSCEVEVQINDTVDPEFVNCPTEMIMIGNDPDECSGKLNWSIPVATDNCEVASIVQTAGPAVGSVIAVCDLKTVTYKATDASGNTTYCSFEVLVIDTQDPDYDADILMPGNITVECDAVPAPFVLTNDDVNDNCTAPQDLVINFTETSTQDPNEFNCGHYNYTITRTWTITDQTCVYGGGGNVTTHVQIITVHDTTAPVAVCQNITVTLDKFGNATITGLQINNGSSDNCAPAYVLTYAASPNTFTCADLGDNEVILTVTDPCGNAATCTAIVTVVEGIAPCVPEYEVATTCLDNATTLTNGQFAELITIKSLAGQTWTVANSTGLYTNGSPAPPAAPVPVANGAAFTMGTADGIDNDGDGSTDEADEMIYYTLRARFVEGVGYTATVKNNLNQTGTISNKAYYPTPVFVDLYDPFCISTAPFEIQVEDFFGGEGQIIAVWIDGVPVAHRISSMPWHSAKVVTRSR
ncbi:MAG: HYR domain-containing protein [Saprospirales bacterium]|nr:HYR domain-containing protein [Saprospirales bacterium]